MPLLMAPSFTWRTAIVLSGCTRNTKAPAEPCWIAAVGMAVTSLRVSTCSRTLTNWFGKSASSVLSNLAFSFSVPVVTSIWLSSVSSVPVAMRRVSARS
ncbi:hypothetical protein D3C72_2013850 [compost metagenome]